MDFRFVLCLGLLRETMVHCLRALRNNYHMLLATMEVFVQEPSVDWLELASKHESLNKDSHKGKVAA
jgi:phosphatidylinositol kinase/protein kinase (PI-3  family)